MQFAPFLLQAFAARALATAAEVKIARADLEREGYDVETLCEMIRQYAAMPEADREFEARANATEIFLRRKANTPAPTLPQGVPPLTVPAKEGVPAASPAKQSGGYRPSSGRTGTQ